MQVLSFPAGTSQKELAIVKICEFIVSLMALTQVGRLHFSTLCVFCAVVSYIYHCLIFQMSIHVSVWQKYLLDTE